MRSILLWSTHKIVYQSVDVTRPHGKQPVVGKVRFYASKLTIAFSEALYRPIRTDLILIEALQSLTIESRHLLGHWKQQSNSTSSQIRLKIISIKPPTAVKKRA